MPEGKIRVLISKLGLDGHDRGVLIVTQALRDAGMEVIYGGIKQTPENLVGTAIQEDVDAIGLSILSGAHTILMPKVMQLLRESGVDDILVIVGGVIPPEDVPKLKEFGVAEVFGPGTDTNEIVKYIRENIRAKRS